MLNPSLSRNRPPWLSALLRGWAVRRYAWGQICPHARVGEAYSALCALWWTFLLTVPGNLFATNRSFLGLERHGHETAWALWTGAVFLLWGIRLCYPAPMMRFVLSLGGVLVWSFIAASITQSAPRWHGLPVNTGFGVYLLLSAFAAQGAFGIAPYVVNDVAVGFARRRGRRGGAR